MSKENLDQFIQKVTDDEELQARIGDEIDIDSLIALGAEHGCEFNAEDLAAGVELSDERVVWVLIQPHRMHSVSVAISSASLCWAHPLSTAHGRPILAVAPMETIFRLSRCLIFPSGVWTQYI